MNRKTAREIAVQLCFASANSGQSADELMERFFAEEHYGSLLSEDVLFMEKPDKRQLAYIKRLVSLTEEKRGEIDAYIEKYAKDWKLSRISKTALAILRCAIAEIRYMEDVPDSVAINEAVELVKKYDVDTAAASYINGVLGSYVRNRSK